MRQLEFFDEDKGLSVQEAAKMLNVSQASIRNWIKTSYLEYEKKRGISLKSFDFFINNIAGKEKLNQRANKSLFDFHDHSTLIKKIEENIFNPDIADIYQENLSLSYRNKEGIYYTPPYICEVMLSDMPKPSPNQTFCDPCCGSGNFIMQAIEFGFDAKNIYGYDVDPVAVNIAKKRFLEKTGQETENIKCLDFLNNIHFEKFDYIATNPPWGKKISKLEKENYARKFGIETCNDTCSLFVFAALFVLRENGFMAFLMPDSFFKIASFRQVREKLLENRVMSLIDFGNPFKGIQSKAQSFCIQKTLQHSNTIKCGNKDNIFLRTQNSFLKNPSQIINFSTNHQEQEVIDRIYSQPHLTLKGNARWGLGIVTGNNARLCHPRRDEGFVPVYRGVDIHADHLDEATNFISPDFSLYQQVPPIELFEAREKVIYRFISSRLIFYHDKQQRYFLNSANMIILDENLPIKTGNLVDLFNSELYNWLFNKLFNTNKVLRSDLEKLPLPVDFFQENAFGEEKLLNYFSLDKDENGAFRLKE